MFRKRLRFEVVQGETEHITFGGKKVRRPTVLIRVGKLSLSKKAFFLGATLLLCQLLDGLLTYIGLSLLGTHMEGNTFLKALIHAYGMLPALFAAKLGASIAVVALTWHAHNRRWIRPAIFLMILVYISLAVVPWTYLISKAQAKGLFVEETLER